MSILDTPSGSGTTDYALELAKGNIAGHSIDTKFGRNTDIDPATQALIWDFGPQQSLEVLLTADTELFVSSSSAADTNIGILIVGMTDTYTKQSSVHIHTQGQTQHSMGTWFRIDSMTIISGSSPQGDLYIAEADTLTLGVPNTPAKVHGFMFQGTGTTHKASGTVPAGHTLYINRVFLGVRRGEDCVFSFYAKTPDMPDFIEASDFPLYQSSVFLTFDPPFPIEEKTDFHFRGLTVTNNTQASVNIGSILVDNTGA